MLVRMHAIIYADIDGSIFYVSSNIDFLSLIVMRKYQQIKHKCVLFINCKHLFITVIFILPTDSFNSNEYNCKNCPIKYLIALFVHLTLFCSFSGIIEISIFSNGVPSKCLFFFYFEDKKSQNKFNVELYKFKKKEMFMIVKNSRQLSNRVQTKTVSSQ